MLIDLDKEGHFRKMKVFLFHFVAVVVKRFGFFSHHQKKGMFC